MHVEQPTQPGRIIVFNEASLGLRAVLVIDAVRGGMSAGGTRTRTYASPLAAVRDARELAQAMDLKCAIAGLNAGGAKMVILDNPALNRAAAFRYLGERIQALGGIFYTAGDLGTTIGDLRQMAETTRYVRTDEASLAGAVGRGVRACAEACARVRGHETLNGLRVAVQGCGAIGAAVSSALAEAGAVLQVADLNPDSAAEVTAATGATIVAPDAILAADVDLLAPCAVGGVINDDTVDSIRAWGVCGAANNILAGDDVGARLVERDVLFVPDFIASAGAVIAGICSVQDRDDAEAVIDDLGTTTRTVLRTSREEGVTPTEAALALAAARRRA